MSTQYCPSCLSSNIEGGRCRKCGFIAANYVAGKTALPMDSMIGKYRVGMMKTSSRQSQIYTGVCDETSQPVIIEEFFPSLVVGRVVGSLSVAFIRQDPAAMQRFQEGLQFMETSEQKRPLQRIDIVKTNNTVYSVFMVKQDVNVDVQCEALADNPVFFRDQSGPRMTINTLPIPPMPKEREYNPKQGKVPHTVPNVTYVQAPIEPEKQKRKPRLLLVAAIVLIVLAMIATALIILLHSSDDEEVSFETQPPEETILTSPSDLEQITEEETKENTKTGSGKQEKFGPTAANTSSTNTNGVDDRRVSATDDSQPNSTEAKSTNPITIPVGVVSNTDFTASSTYTPTPEPSPTRGSNEDSAEGFTPEPPSAQESTEESTEGSTSELPSSQESTEESTKGSTSELPSDQESTEESTEGPASELPSDQENTEDPAEGSMSELPSDQESTEDPAEGPTSELPSDQGSMEDPTEGSMQEPTPTQKLSEEPTNTPTPEPTPQTTFSQWDILERTGTKNTPDITSSMTSISEPITQEEFVDYIYLMYENGLNRANQIDNKGNVYPTTEKLEKQKYYKVVEYGGEIIGSTYVVIEKEVGVNYRVNLTELEKGLAKLYIYDWKNSESAKDSYVSLAYEKVDKIKNLINDPDAQFDIQDDKLIIEWEGINVPLPISRDK